MSAPNNQPISREDKDRFKAYYQSGERGWGPLSLVLKSSLNVKDGHVVACRQAAVEACDDEAIELADILAGLSKSQRIKLGQQLE